MSYTVVAAPQSPLIPINELRTSLEKGNETTRLETMKTILCQYLNGDNLSALLMHVIRFVMPNSNGNKALKKLMCLFFEVCPKRGEDGKLQQEWILVCNAIRNDLQHPNEYVRGNMLRFVCKLNEIELLEPLVPSVRLCLEHRHAYVRKNAVFAAASIYKHHENAFPDVPDYLVSVLRSESVASAKRNAFLALLQVSQDKAVAYMLENLMSVTNEGMQLAFLDVISRDRNSRYKGVYLEGVVCMLESSHSSVKFEAAMTLTMLTGAPSAVRACSKSLVQLALKESDNSAKLIVLARLSEITQKYKKTLEESVMDILRVLSVNDLAVKTKVLAIVLDLVSTKTVNEVVAFMKKEIGKSVDNGDYCQVLIQSLHQCAIRYPELAGSCVDVLMDSISDANAATGSDVVVFLREVAERHAVSRGPLLERMCHILNDIKHAKVVRGCLWLLGEFSESEQEISLAIKSIMKCVGSVPIRDESKADSSVVAEAKAVAESKVESKTRVLPDGTYATESIYVTKTIKTTNIPFIRSLILEGDFFVASTLATTLTRLCLKSKSASIPSAMLTISSIMTNAGSTIDENSFQRMMLCLRALGENNKSLVGLLVKANRPVLHDLLNKTTHVDNVKPIKPIDQGITFSLLKCEEVLKIDQPTTSSVNSRLDKIVQLTGYSDPIYAEAIVMMAQFDISIDVLIVNQTADTLQNVQLEFSTCGDLKLVERPGSVTLGGHGFHSCKATIKVSSSDNGVIFGNLIYDGSKTGDTDTIVLNDIKIDIMEYMRQTECTETSYRKMWVDFEWENKISTKVQSRDAVRLLEYLMSKTKMICLVKNVTEDEECDFVAANLYCKSVFGKMKLYFLFSGEDVVANVSWERSGDWINGHIRIRCRSQGIAHSFGEKLIGFQKEFK